MFLAKYIPATPPPLKMSSEDGLKRRKMLFRRSPSHSRSGADDNSPCPSPTPLFQQLYAAVSHWERVLAGSPELLKEVLGKYSPEESTEENNPVQLRAARSMHNLSASKIGLAVSRERELSMRRKSSPGGLLLRLQQQPLSSAVTRKKSEIRTLNVPLCQISFIE